MEKQIKKRKLVTSETEVNTDSFKLDTLFFNGNPHVHLKKNYGYPVYTYSGNKILISQEKFFIN